MYCILVLVSVAQWGPTSRGALVHIIKPTSQKDLGKFTFPLYTSIIKLYYLWFPSSTFKNSSTFFSMVKLFHTIFSTIFYYNGLKTFTHCLFKHCFEWLKLVYYFHESIYLLHPSHFLILLDEFKCLVNIVLISLSLTESSGAAKLLDHL